MYILDFPKYQIKRKFFNINICKNYFNSNKIMLMAYNIVLQAAALQSYEHHNKIVWKILPVLSIPK